jgi:hypothetical protein
MSILDRLFEGSIQPSGRQFHDPEFDEQRSIYSEKEQEFIRTLTKEQREMYDEVCTERNLLGCIYQKESFKDGFKLAIQFMNEASNYESLKHLIDTEHDW